jgi:hypothetical protein
LPPGMAGTALAQAKATGASGSATANAVAGSANIGETISSAASGPTAGGQAFAASYSAVSQPVSGAPSAAGTQAFAINTGLPSNSDAKAALSNSPNVQKDFDLGDAGVEGPTSTALGLITLGGGSNPDGSQHIYTSSTIVNFSLATAPTQHLILGLLSPSSGGNGFDSLMFTVKENSSLVLQDVTFHTLGDANTYFTDTAIDLGSSSNLQTIEFDLSVTTTSPSDYYDASLIYGDATLGSDVVPEPSCSMLFLAIGAGALIRRRRRA